MLNFIWLALILLAVLIGGFDGRIKELTEGAVEGAKMAVTLALGLIGIMALWLGVMRLAEKSGLVQALARGLRPVLRRLFPDVPMDHPAMGAMVMNIAANMLGLSNAATPLGLRAMRDLESLNRTPGTATNAMCTFLAINTSSVQLIPITAVAILAAAKSANPSAIIGTAFLATLCAAMSAILAVKTFEKLNLLSGRPADPVAPEAKPLSTAASKGNDAAASRLEAVTVAPMPAWGLAALLLFAGCFICFFLSLAYPGAVGGRLAAEQAMESGLVRSVKAISLLAIPFLLAFFPLYAGLRRVAVYEEFVEGAKEGFNVAVRIIPFLVAMLVAIGMFRGAGGVDLLTRALRPVLDLVHFPAELLPISLMRPLSGSASLAIFSELVKQYGPDHLISRTAGTLYGSTETTFYVLAVYFGSVGVKRTRHAVPAGLVADAVGVIASVIICRLVFT
jgi:spore maturation protein SpmA